MIYSVGFKEDGVSTQLDSYCQHGIFIHNIGMLSHDLCDSSV